MCYGFVLISTPAFIEFVTRDLVQSIIFIASDQRFLEKTNVK